MRETDRHIELFNTIAFIYGRFYKAQKGRYRSVVETMNAKIDLLSHQSILDVGCGTGALSSALHELGMQVSGVDPAIKMLELAMKRSENEGIRFQQANVLEGLPFDNDAFGISIASYVAHGLSPVDRLRMYAEMNRVTCDYVIIYDYNQNRSLMTSLIEYLEQGDYFNFIQEAESELREYFGEVKIVDVGPRASWYICSTHKRTLSDEVAQ